MEVIRTEMLRPWTISTPSKMLWEKVRFKSKPLYSLKKGLGTDHKNVGTVHFNVFRFNPKSNFFIQPFYLLYPSERN